MVCQVNPMSRAMKYLFYRKKVLVAGKFHITDKTKVHDI